MSNYKYSASMVSCLFWLQETRKTAELMEQGHTLEEIRVKAVEENIYQVRATDRAIRIVGVSVKRLSALSEQLRRQFLVADIKNAKLILLLAILKTDLLFYEFMHTTFKEAVILGEKSLTDSAITIFFDTKIAESREVAAFSEGVIKKLKQVYVKTLVEADILSDIRQKLIQLPLIDYRLYDALEKAGMLPYVTTLTGDDYHA